MKTEIHPLTPRRWPDLERLFGPRGACAGCWCMYWRRSAGEYRTGKGEGNRAALRALVEGVVPPGVLAYRDGEPVGWCAVAPRAELVRLRSSRILRPLDDTPVWSLVCLFVHRAARRSGVSVELIRGACRWAASRGAEVVEAYPVEPRKEAVPDAFAWTGLRSAFDRAGFREAGRGSETRPIMRWTPARPVPGRGAC